MLCNLYISISKNKLVDFANSDVANVISRFSWKHNPKYLYLSEISIFPQEKLKLHSHTSQSKMCDFGFITIDRQSDLQLHSCSFANIFWSESASVLYHLHITKTCLYNFDPLKPHFYIVKLGFTGVYIIFLISAKNIDCGYSLEPPRWGGSNEYPQSMFLAEIWKISEFYLKIFIFLMVKFSVYLNRLVFVMIQGNWQLYIIYFNSHI